jgi:hypothetical protein
MSTRPGAEIDPEQSQTLAPTLLELLSTKLGKQVGFEEAPRRVLGGNQTFVHTFRLARTEPPWDASLILRILRPHRDESEALFETVVQNALVPLAPRVLLHDLDDDPSWRRLPDHGASQRPGTFDGRDRTGHSRVRHVAVARH